MSMTLDTAIRIDRSNSHLLDLFNLFILELNEAILLVVDNAPIMPM